MFLRRLSSAGQKHVGAAVGLSESAISNWKDGKLIERFCKALAFMGLQLVPGDARCHPADYIESLKTLSRRCLELESKRPGPIGWD
ncbi:hypothetical protein PS870_06517 [Pseudomonas fluorescens]|uniref:Transcriptional regulator n=2 Tax=Pseudomonas fluorescens TaxID=294 RepID=A0A5E7QT13_PSEFL|nr:hypothetical protein PS870_06517 [Pseudomonas fluorescens]